MNIILSVPRHSVDQACHKNPLLALSVTRYMVDPVFDTSGVSGAICISSAWQLCAIP